MPKPWRRYSLSAVEVRTQINYIQQKVGVITYPKPNGECSDFFKALSVSYSMIGTFIGCTGAGFEVMMSYYRIVSIHDHQIYFLLPQWTKDLI